jgi:hypothetical protein
MINPNMDRSNLMSFLKNNVGKVLATIGMIKNQNNTMVYMFHPNANENRIKTMKLTMGTSIVCIKLLIDFVVILLVRKSFSKTQFIKKFSPGHIFL